jgi:thiamine pyrophosphokinase
LRRRNRKNVRFEREKKKVNLVHNKNEARLRKIKNVLAVGAPGGRSEVMDWLNGGVKMIVLHY